MVGRQEHHGMYENARTNRCNSFLCDVNRISCYLSLNFVPDLSNVLMRKVGKSFASSRLYLNVFNKQ